MSQFKNIIYILIITALIFSVTGLTSTNSEFARVQSEVLDIASDAPDQSVRVIIQKTKSATEVEALINKLGGECLKDLPFINAVVAEIAAQNAIQLSKSPAVRWVSLDAPMVRSSSESYTIRDEFNSKSYDNNDGTATWRSDWVEIGDNGSPSSGAIKIHKGYLRLILANRAIQRQVDLSGAQYAFLSFEYQKNSLGNGETISIQVSPDGGLFWFELDQIEGGDHNFDWVQTSYDISSYIGYNTTIRFIGGSNLEGFDLIKIDNVQIEFNGGQGQGGTISDDLLTVGDDFEIRSFNNNTGTANWIGDWIEIGEDNGANRGFVRIGKVPTTKNLGLGFLKENVGAQRMVDLSGAIYARLDLAYQVANLQSEKFVALEISKDGGTTWVELDRLKGASTLLFSNQVSYNIADFISAQTIIRFITSDDYAGGVVFINEIQIEYNDGTAPNNTYLDTLNVKPVWDMGYKGEGVTVVVVDSGITHDQDFSLDPSLSTSGSRLIAQSNFNNDSSFLGDAYGHGTHLAGIIGGNGFMSNGAYQGIAPGVNLIGLKISDDQGMAYESNTVNALAWILEHKDEHNIRVVNLSINSTVEDFITIVLWMLP